LNVCPSTNRRADQHTTQASRLHPNTSDVNPKLKSSPELIAFGGGPTTEAAWNSAEAYWRVYQDWRAWTEEGILDIAMPMNYKREHMAPQPTQYDQWNEWAKNHQYNRAVLIGSGGLVNGIEGSL